MFSRKLTVGVLSAACFIMIGTVRAADTVLLRPKHTPGQTYYLEQDQKIVVDQSAGQGSMKINVHRIYGFIQKVEEATADRAEVSLTFDRVSQKFEMGSMMNASYDSDDPENEDTSPEVAAAMAPMLGMPLTFELDKDFHVSSATGMVDIRDKINKVAKNNQFLRQLSQELEDDRSKVSYGESRYALYPNKEVKVGDQWQREFIDKHPRFGKSIYHYDCKLDRLTEEDGRKVAVIAYQGTLQSAPPDPATSQPGEQMSVEGKFEGTGTFDIELGLITHSLTKGKTKVRPLSADGKPTSIGGTKIDLELDLEWKVTPMADRLKAKEEVKEKAEAAKMAAEEKKAARKKAREERRKKAAEAKKESGDQDEKNDEGGDE